MKPKRIECEVIVQKAGSRHAAQVKCLECERCGQSEPGRLDREAAVSQAFGRMKADCPGRLNHAYYELVVPKGLTLWNHHLGRWHKLWMTGRTICSDFAELPTGDQTALFIYVVNDGACKPPVERRFVRKLARLGYRTKTCQGSYNASEFEIWTMGLEREIQQRERNARREAREAALAAKAAKRKARVKPKLQPSRKVKVKR